MKPLMRLEQAERDAEAAIAWYLQEAPEVVDDFIDALGAAIAHIRRHPGTGSPRYAHELKLPGLRCWPAGRFPYLLFYMEEPDRLLLVRVLHSRSDIPTWMLGDA